MNQSSNFNATGNPRAFRFISYTLVFLVMACCAMSIGILIQVAVPDWSSDIIAGITLFIIMDRLYTYKRMKSLIPFSREWAITLGTQWVVIALFIKTLLSYTKDFDTLARDISSFTRGYLANLFDLEFIVTLLLAVLVWYMTGLFLALLDELGLDQKWAPSEALAPGQGDVMTAHQRLVHLTLQLGIGLVILTALTRINLSSLYNVDGTLKELKHFSGAEAGALLYFIFGFALLSLTRLMGLQTSWHKQNIPVTSNKMARQWGIYSFFFLFILTVVVGFLSSGNNLELFSLLGILFSFLARVFIFIAHLIWSLLYLLSILPFLLFGKTVPTTNVFPPTPTPTPPPDPLADYALPASDPFLTLIRSIFLWGALLAMIGFSVARFVRLHGGFQAAFRKIPIANWLFFAWQWLGKNADEARKALSRTIADAWQRIVSRHDGERLFPRPDLIRLGALDPRRQIYFFYLAMIRRGSQQGVERKSSQTPSEYAVTLERALPSANEDVHSITESFVEARYSLRKINSAEANLVKAAWGRVRRALQTPGTPPGKSGRN